jgi:uncharacterized protein
VASTFQTSTPVTASWFANRRAELAELEAHIRRLVDGAPSWVCVFGPRKIGKTSLLLETAARDRAEPILFVILDTFEEAPVSPAIFRRYALRVVDAFFAREVGASLEAVATSPAELRALLQESASFARLPPALRAFVLELAEQPIDADFVKRAIDLPERLAQALGRLVAVAWDEFQELTDLTGSPFGDPLPLLRSIWQRHRRTTYIVSGSARTMLRRLVTERHSPFFHHFAMLEVGPFAREDAIRLLTDRSEAGRAIPETVAVRAVDLVGGSPFYLQLVGETLERLPGPVDDDALRQAVQELLFSRTGRLALYFEAQFAALVGRSTYLAAVLTTLAEGPRRVSEIAKAIGAPAGATIKYLERLGDAVVKEPDGYRLDDATFGLWLLWRRPGGAAVPMKLLGDEAELAIAEDLVRMGFDLVYQSRASRGPFDLLGTRESSQLGIQVKKTALPVSFARSEWNRMVAEGKRFGWSWVIAAVTPGSRKVYLDPARAKKRQTVRLGEDAAIDNLLLWLSRQPRES